MAEAEEDAVRPEPSPAILVERANAEQEDMGDSAEGEEQAQGGAAEEKRRRKQACPQRRNSDEFDATTAPGLEKNNQPPLQMRARMKKFSLASHKMNSSDGVKDEVSPQRSPLLFYECRVCHKAFQYISRLARHMKTHSGERPFRCEECGKTFNQAAHLQTHQAIHSGKRPYQCDICHATFSRPDNARRHQLTHTGQKPFQCGVCEKTFRQAGNLTEHLRTHTGEKPYRCDVCQATFARSDGLLVHRRTHTGEKPYRCELCGMTYRQHHHLVKHKRLKHSQETAAVWLLYEKNSALFPGSKECACPRHTSVTYSLSRVSLMSSHCFVSWMVTERSNVSYSTLAHSHFQAEDAVSTAHCVHQSTQTKRVLIFMEHTTSESTLVEALVHCFVFFFSMYIHWTAFPALGRTASMVQLLQALVWSAPVMVRLVLSVRALLKSVMAVPICDAYRPFA